VTAIGTTVELRSQVYSNMCVVFHSFPPNSVLFWFLILSCQKSLQIPPG
jgi:hypothetical protein